MTYKEALEDYKKGTGGSEAYVKAMEALTVLAQMEENLEKRCEADAKRYYQQKN